MPIYSPFAAWDEQIFSIFPHLWTWFVPELHQVYLHWQWRWRQQLPWSHAALRNNQTKSFVLLKRPLAKFRVYANVVLPVYIPDCLFRLRIRVYSSRPGTHCQAFAHVLTATSTHHTECIKNTPTQQRKLATRLALDSWSSKQHRRWAWQLTRLHTHTHTHTPTHKHTSF